MSLLGATPGPHQPGRRSCLIGPVTRPGSAGATNRPGMTTTGTSMNVRRTTAELATGRKAECSSRVDRLVCRCRLV